jgi:hypothetical protein
MGCPVGGSMGLLSLRAERGNRTPKERSFIVRDCFVPRNDKEKTHNYNDLSLRAERGNRTPKSCLEWFAIASYLAMTRKRHITAKICHCERSVAIAHPKSNQLR